MRTHPTSRIARLALVTAATAALAVTATACDADGGTASHTSASHTGAADGSDAAPTDTSSGTTDSGAAKQGGGAPVAGSPVAKGSAPRAERPAAPAKPARSGASGASSGGGGWVRQSCGADDLSWKVTPKSQQGGYLQISVTAKPGITCWLPEDLPMVAFGSHGIQAQPAEQSVGVPIKLHGSRTAYAGINPKTTKDDEGTQFEDVVLATDGDDTTSVILHTGPVLVDNPIVTDWHTNPADVVPGTGLDSD